MVVSNSLIFENVFFIFRENGIEVTITINGYGYEASHILTDDEKTYIQTFLISQKIESKINKKLKKNFVV